jgi:ParB-like chromosome segregation protein Spo0J
MARAKPAPQRFETTRLPIGQLVPNPRNPRRHPQEQLDQLVASVKRFGQPRPVLVRRENLMIVAGHGVTEACRVAGLAEIAVVLWDVDQATADAFMLGDNRLARLGKDDKAQIADLLRQIGIGDLEGLGYTAAEADALLADTVEDLDVVEVPTGEVADRFWISVRGPLAQQSKALQQLKVALADVPEVEVELGTIADA